MVVKPLQKRIMTLNELRKRTLKVLRECRKQFNGNTWADGGLTDAEFIAHVLEPLMNDIRQDIDVEKIIAANNAGPATD